MEFNNNLNKEKKRITDPYQQIDEESKEIEFRPQKQSEIERRVTIAQGKVRIQIAFKKKQELEQDRFGKRIFMGRYKPHR